MTSRTSGRWGRDAEKLIEALLLAEDSSEQTTWGERWLDESHDGVAALHDIEALAGDEQELADLFSIDHKAARQLRVHLDSTGAEEPVLD